MGTGRNLVATLLLYPFAQIFHLRLKLVFLWEKYELVNFSLILWSKGVRLYQKIFSIQEYISCRHVIVEILLKWLVSLIHWSVMLWRAQKPNCLALSSTLCLIWLWTILRINSSNSLPVVGKRLIGHKFLGNFYSLPAFGNGISFASSNDLVR